MIAKPPAERNHARSPGQARGRAPSDAHPLWNAAPSADIPAPALGWQRPRTGRRRACCRRALRPLLVLVSIVAVVVTILVRETLDRAEHRRGPVVAPAAPRGHPLADPTLPYHA